jgi:hypothetical protein
MPSASYRSAVRSLLIVAFAVGAALTAASALTGGFAIRFWGISASSRGLVRPLLLLGVSVGLLALLDGPRRLTAALGRLAAARWPCHSAAVGLALTTFALGAVFNSTAASGSDAYGYLSQADLWIRGDLVVRQPWVAEVPWPNAEWTFAPLGYRPAARGAPGDIVPTYSPGLPLLMAAAKRLGGQQAMFLVVPLSGAVLVLATYAVGLRLSTRRVALVGAWLVATSPAVLVMLVLPMSDVPVAAAWTTVFLCVLVPGWRWALLAGLVAASAIVIRPNLVFLGPVIGAWYVARRSPSRTSRARDCLAYGVGMALGAAFIALLNQRLYGSALTSGYGSLGELLAIGHVLPNLRRYSSWLVSVHSPLVLLGVVMLLVPLRAAWPQANRAVFAVILAFVGSLWLFYCAYLEFAEWWYLRFLLASWPFLMLGLAALSLSLTKIHRMVGGLAMVGLAILGGYWFRSTSRDVIEDSWRDERRYPAVAEMVRASTPENSVILSMQHSGTIRYYGARSTMRYDQLDGAWLDKAVEWLAAHQVQTFLVADDWELARIQTRFSTERLARVISAGAMAVYQPARSDGATRLYDLSGAGVPPVAPPPTIEDLWSLRAVPPTPPKPLRFR